MADKAFLAGINDYETIGDLRGCVNDTHSIRRLLVDTCGFDAENIRTKTDSEVTKSELTKGWKWLLKGAKPGDRLVFHFSGHGSYTADADGESGEADFRDELLCLYGMDWGDPDTYLLDDELGAWTAQIPDGVDVTFLLDCCHSGTGTRFVQPELSRAARSDFRTAASLSLDEVAMRRSGESVGRRARSVGDSSQLHPTTQQEIGPQSVLARFAPPPVEVDLAIGNATKNRSFRGVIGETRQRSADESAMNHVLWSGCRDNQTSADAYIGGDYHGAFTYYFCKSIRDAGKTPNAVAVIESLRDLLQNEQFDQVPQLEPEDTAKPVFGGKPAGEDPVDEAGDTGAGELTASAGEWRQLLTLVQRIADRLDETQPGFGRTSDAGALRSGGQSLVYVHGICEHHAGYSDDWWNALSPHLSPAVRGALGANRKEVLWSRHVSQLSRSDELEIDPVEQQQMELTLQAILAERMVHEAAEQIAEQDLQRGIGEPPPGPAPRAALGIPGVNCVDDFVKYLSSDSIRRSVIAECTNVLRPLLQRGEAVELISHSWGTVVAYEALRSLEREGLSGRVHSWFTVGAALAIQFVAQRLRPRDGQKPSMVDHWINLDARGDGVGGSIRATGMRVDHEYLRLNPSGCRSTLGFVTPACAHASYFRPGNLKVNRDIFAKWIQQS